MKQIGIIDNLFLKPLHYVMQNKIMETDFNIKIVKENEIVKNLSNGEIDVAEMSVLEFAKNPGSFKVLPGMCCGFKKFSGRALLFFNKHKQTFKKILLNSENELFKTLAKIIILEKFEMDAEFVEIQKNESLNILLEEFDAVLLQESAVLEIIENTNTFLDLGEEWKDFTGFEFITHFWSAKIENIDNKMIDVLQRAKNAGEKYIPEIIEKSNVPEQNRKVNLKKIFHDNYFYTWNEKNMESLKKFWEYSFYYGLIEHIPENIFYDEKL